MLCISLLKIVILTSSVAFPLSKMWFSLLNNTRIRVFLLLMSFSVSNILLRYLQIVVSSFVCIFHVLLFLCHLLVSSLASALVVLLFSVIFMVLWGLWSIQCHQHIVDLLWKGWCSSLYSHGPRWFLTFQCFLFVSVLLLHEWCIGHKQSPCGTLMFVVILFPKFFPTFIILSALHLQLVSLSSVFHLHLELLSGHQIDPFTLLCQILWACPTARWILSSLMMLWLFQLISSYWKLAQL